MKYDPLSDTANKLLIVYNETTVAERLQSSLRKEGWETLIATDNAEALHIVEREMPDLVIFYLAMLKLDRYEILQQVRNWWLIPVIVIGTPSGIDDKVKCLNLGADDYITEPFRIEEMVARVKAIIRRSTSIAGAYFTQDSLEIDFSARRVIVSGKEVRLTPIEFRILHQLVINAGKVLTHNYLLARIWGREYGHSREYLHVFISRLRSKLEINPKQPKHIITVPGIGYRFQKGD